MKYAVTAEEFAEAYRTFHRGDPPDRIEVGDQTWEDLDSELEAFARPAADLAGKRVLLLSGMQDPMMPAAMAAHGIGTLELCHFHLPSTDADYLAAFRQALADHGIELYSVLIDTGDLVAPDPARQAADRATIAGWLPIAAALGASRVRIDAGAGLAGGEEIDRAGAPAGPARRRCRRR